MIASDITARLDLIVIAGSGALICLYLYEWLVKK